ncbi:helix-turn-helix domain-containing protein [Streptomyces sp. XD-27]|uniref:nSTAND1 domain-containing NTPase n=1 Tax=Streptomyces sp. XD-27 TaxID=3062779 RepID=UPI0026F44B81|nr:helix-turn-helix domain-containing protein [Streptomyces sp. XD-27]WKX72695.1 helix-turn-helix domain-containing protein [Streptomyces sp. XD-27]
MGRRESPLDPSAGPVQRFAYELRKLRQEAGGLTYRAMAQRARYSVTTLSQAAAGEQLPSLPVALAYVEACGGDRADWEARWREAAAEAAEAAAGERAEDDAAAEPPYRGLARFEPGDHAHFFGRDRLVADVTDLARGNRFAAVFGPSGSGKSSLLRAGLIPALRGDGGPDGRGSGKPGDRTGRSPDAPGEPPPPPAVIRVLTPGEHPARTHRDALVPRTGGGDTWLIVDQFEEVFTLCQDPAERAEFIDALLAARDPGSRLRVVVAVRADFFGRCAEHRALTAALRDATLLVGPMGRAELREAIVRPAAAAGLIVERALTARIVAEVADEPGGLPLMSHALLETWRRRRGRTLTEEAYEAVGGVHGAIAATAERVYGELSPHQADLARRLLLRLITPGEGAQDTRRPVDRAELATGSGDAAAVLERLVRARLVTVDKGVVDLAHEALITAWPRLRGWIEEDRGRLRVHRKLTEAARAWDELDRDPGALYRGARLAEAEEAFGSEAEEAFGSEPERGDLTSLERAFLTASRGGRTRERRRVRAAIGTLSLLLVLAVVAGAVAWQADREGDQRRAEATSRRVASIAENMRATDPATAMRLSAAAWRISHTVEARAALLGAVAQREQDAFILPGAGADSRLVLSADGRRLVTAAPDRVRGWDGAAHRQTGGFRVTGEEQLADLSPDGRHVVMSAGDRLRIRDLASGKPVGPPIGLRSVDETVAYAPSGRTLLFESEEGVRLWDVRQGRVVFQRKGAYVASSAVSPDDRFVALCRGNALEVWDVGARREVRTLRRPAVSRALCGVSDDDLGRVSELLFDPRSHSLVAVEEGLRSWDLRSGRERPRLDHDGLLGEVRFSRDGRFVAAVDDEKILLWRILPDSYELVYRNRAVGEDVSDLRLDPDHGVIRYREGEGSGSAVVRTLFLGDAMASPWHQAPSEGSRIGPDGRLVVMARRAGERMRFELRPTGGGGRATALPPLYCGTGDRPDEVCWAHMAFSGDGGTLAYGVGRLSLADPVGAEQGEQPLPPERIRFWDLRRNRERADLVLSSQKKRTTGLDSIALSSDGAFLLALRQGPGATLEKWDVARRTKAVRRAEPEYGSGGGWSTPPSDAMAVRPDGRRLATTHGMSFALPSGRWTHNNVGQIEALSLAYSPDGNRLAMGERSGRVTVYDGDVTRRLGSLTGTYSDLGHGEESAGALAYSHDGTLLAVAGDQGTVRLWDTASGRPLGGPLPTAGDGIQAVAFSEDDRTLLVAGEHVSPRSYAIDPDRVTATVCERAGGGLSRADWKTYIPEVPYRDVC